MSDNDWGAELRAFRLRKKMKQEAVASHLGVSQAYISRLEAGVTMPTPEIVARIEQLLRTRENRPHFDHWLATVRYSTGLPVLLRYDDGQAVIIEIGRGYRELDAPFNGLRAGDRINSVLGSRIEPHLREMIALGLFDGEVMCMEGLWKAKGERMNYYFRSVNVPVRDDLGSWYVHATNLPISREEFETLLKSGHYPIIDREQQVNEMTS